MANQGAWVTLDFHSGHDLTVQEFEPHIGICADGAEPAWDALSLSLCPSPAHVISLSLSNNKTLNK